jgi:nucleoside-diphosphate-sugar epimerase
MSLSGGERVFITGATGFIGSNLAQRCLERGAEVFINLRKTSDTWRIRNILKEVNAVPVDIIEYEKLRGAIRKIHPDIIFHTAAYGGSANQKTTEKIIETNIIGTVNLVRSCRGIGISLIVNTGSSSEYGVKNSPMDESALLEPVTEYGVSKAAATLFCQSYATGYNLPIVTLRLFSPYGRYEEKSRLVPSVILSALQRINPKISSPGFVRDFVYIDDILDAYESAINVKNPSGDIFNIGSGQQHSVGEVVDEIIRILGNEVTYETCIPQAWKNEPAFWQADIRKARSELSWEPEFSLERGLAATVDWFKVHKGIYGLQPELA